MSKTIYQALTKDFINRMRDWALGQDVPTVSSSWPMDDPMSGIKQKHRFFRTRTPFLLGEVHDTGVAIDGLPARYKLAVRQFWLFEGRSLRWHGRHRQVNYETFEAWVVKGHELLKVSFALQHAAWRVQVEETPLVQSAGDHA